MAETLKAESPTVSEYLPAGKKLSVVVAANSSAIVERYLDGAFLDKTAIAAGVTRVFGEYLIGVQVNITCLSGSLTYETLQHTGPRATQTDDDAAAGEVGEYMSSTVGIGSAVSLTTNTSANVTSITLTPGDWDVDGTVGLAPGATTSITHVSGSSSLTSDTSGGLGGEEALTFPAVVPGASLEWFLSLPTRRVKVAEGTTQVVYLVAHAVFTVSTLGAYGVIRARRVR